MKPYYQNASITLYYARWQDVIDEIKTTYQIDHVVTDPPYSEETHSGAKTNPQTELGRWRQGGNESQPLISFDSTTAADLRATFAAMIPRRWIISFIDWRHITPLETEPPEGVRFVRFGVWIKTNGAPQFSGDRPATGWEAIAIMHKAGGRMRWSGGGLPATFIYPKAIASKASDGTTHATEKPQALVQRLLSLFTDKGDTILDPFGGCAAY